MRNWTHPLASVAVAEGESRVKIRFLTVAGGVCRSARLALTGCDSKVGTAAVVNGHKISESDASTAT